MTSTSRPSHSASNAAQRSTNAPQSHSAAPSTFYLKERERLITDIADNMEQLLGNVNTLNRKLEESIVVGQEFEPIANLWGPFVDLLTNQGINPTNSSSTAGQSTNEQTGKGNAQQAPATTTTANDHRFKLSQSTGTGTATASADHAADSSFDAGASNNRLPPGVAPGGGTIYGFSSSPSSNQ